MKPEKNNVFDVSALKELSLEEVQQEELRLLCEFDKLCDDNKLTYYLAYGSLLGAIRHEGPIPWDDDVDVLMPFPDYERLLTISAECNDCALVPPAGYNFRFEWAKFISTKTVFIDSSSYNFGDYGVYIDVFPLNALKPGSEDKQINRVKMLRRLKNCGYTRNYKMVSSFKKRLRGYILGLFVRARSYDDWCTLIFAEANGYSYDIADYVANMFSPYSSEKEKIPKTDLTGYSLCNYSGKHFKTFSDPEKYLERVYGKDWRVPQKRPSTSHGKAYWKEQRK